MRTKGIALISVLIMLAIITPIIYQIVIKQQLNTKITYAFKSGGNAIMDALAVEMWARNILLEDEKTSSYDSYTEAWHQELPTTFSDVSVLSGKISDLSSKLNLNNIWYAEDDDFVKILLKLFTNLGVDEFSATSITNALQDWMDGDDEARAIGGAEDSYYMLSEKPYRSANNIMVSVSELKLLRGMTDEIYEKISSYVAVLPVKTKININTAPLEVLRAIFPEKSWSFFQEGSAGGNATQFKSMDEFITKYNESSDVAISDSTLTYISVTSNFFILEAKSSLGDAEIKMNSILQRDNEVKIINRFMSL